MKNDDWIKDLRVELIATYDKPQFDDDDTHACHDETQEIFSVKVSEDMLKSEDTLIDYLRGALDGNQDDLVKLSLCWQCDKELFEDYSVKYETIQKSRQRNSKYAFNAWADAYSFVKPCWS